MTEVFEASVQYNDWLGTSAADNADDADLYSLMKNRGLVSGNEQPLGIEFSFWENFGQNIRPHVRVLVGEFRVTLDNTRPVPVREVRLELTLSEFCGLFKRFSVTLSRRDGGIGVLEGREISPEVDE